MSRWKIPPPGIRGVVYTLKFEFMNLNTFYTQINYWLLPLGYIEIFLVDKNKNFVITGGDGTVLFRVSVQWINKII